MPVESSPCVHGVPDDLPGDGWGLSDFDEDGVSVGPVSRLESVAIVPIPICSLSFFLLQRMCVCMCAQT